MPKFSPTEFCKTLSNPKTGVDAIEEAGMQSGLVKVTEMMQKGLSAIFSYRYGTKPVKDTPGAAKPMEQDTKLADEQQGIFAGRMSLDPNFNKLSENMRGSRRLPLPHGAKTQKLLNSGKQEIIPLPMTLRGVIKNLGPTGVYHYKSYDPKSQTLILTYKEGKGSADFNGELIIDLSKTAEKYINGINPLPKLFKKVSQGVNFAGEELTEILNTNTPVYYSKVKNQRMPAEYRQIIQATPIPKYYIPSDPKDTDPVLKPAMVIAKNGLPITGDWDIEEVLFEKKPIYDTAYNIFDKNQVINLNAYEALLVDSHKLFNELKQNAQGKSELERTDFDKLLLSISFKQILNEGSREKTGRVTPYDFLIISLINYTYNNRLYETDAKRQNLHRNIKDLLQHGFDCLSPYPPNLNGNRLHNCEGKWFITSNMKERIRMYLSEGFLEEYSLKIHPLSPMDKFAPIIERQIQLKQFYNISDATRGCYLKYYEKKLLTGSLQIEQFPKEVGLLIKEIAKNHVDLDIIPQLLRQINIDTPLGVEEQFKHVKAVIENHSSSQVASLGIEQSIHPEILPQSAKRDHLKLSNNLQKVKGSENGKKPSVHK